MSVKNCKPETIELIVSTYRATGSIRTTAQALESNPQTIRRILIEAGEYSTPLIADINRRAEEGDPVEKIAEDLGMSVKVVQSYLPYTRSSYTFGVKTDNATKLAEWRKRKMADP